MSLATPEEFIVGDYLVRINAAALVLPGASGWVGAWSIYHHPGSPRDMPVRYGDTDIQVSETLALGMARAIAKMLAESL